MFRYNLLFFVSGGGKFNYQGTKRWLEDNLDHTGAVLVLVPTQCSQKGTQVSTQLDFLWMIFVP